MLAIIMACFSSSEKHHMALHSTYPLYLRTPTSPGLVRMWDALSVARWLLASVAPFVFFAVPFAFPRVCSVSGVVLSWVEILEHLT